VRRPLLTNQPEILEFIALKGIQLLLNVLIPFGMAATSSFAVTKVNDTLRNNSREKTLSSRSSLWG
jgi:hypothetical protein